MKKLLSLLLVSILVSPVYADTLREQRHQHVLAYSDYIRGQVEVLHKNSQVEIVLKTGTVIKGIFMNYIAYDDTVWINPPGTKNIFKAEAFDINEIYYIVIISEPV